MGAYCTSFFAIKRKDKKLTQAAHFQGNSVKHAIVAGEVHEVYPKVQQAMPLKRSQERVHSGDLNAFGDSWAADQLLCAERVGRMGWVNFNKIQEVCGWRGISVIFRCWVVFV